MLQLFLLVNVIGSTLLCDLKHVKEDPLGGFYSVGRENKQSEFHTCVEEMETKSIEQI